MNPDATEGEVRAYYDGIREGLRRTSWVDQFDKIVYVKIEGPGNQTERCSQESAARRSLASCSWRGGEHGYAASRAASSGMTFRRRTTMSTES